VSSLPVKSIDLDEHRTCLIISSDPADDAFFRTQLGRIGWDCDWADTWSEAREYLERGCVPVVIAREHDALREWREMVRSPWPLSRVPKLIVALETLDDTLWQDLEDIGAYDVLMKPIIDSEVADVVSPARTAWLKEWSVPDHAMAVTH